MLLVIFLDQCVPIAFVLRTPLDCFPKMRERFLGNRVVVLALIAAILLFVVVPVI